MLMANAVMEAAATTPGKEAIAMEAFAKALSELPTAIAENGGFDSAQLVSELRALHKQNKTTMGLGEIWFKIFFWRFTCVLHYTVLSSGIDVEQGINVGPGQFVKTNKRRA